MTEQQRPPFTGDPNGYADLIGYGLTSGYPATELNGLNRAQLRTKLGIEHPVGEQQAGAWAGSATVPVEPPATPDVVEVTPAPEQPTPPAEQPTPPAEQPAEPIVDDVEAENAATIARGEIPQPRTRTALPDDYDPAADLELTGPSWWLHAGSDAKRRTKMQLAADRLARYLTDLADLDADDVIPTPAAGLDLPLPADQVDEQPDATPPTIPAQHTTPAEPAELETLVTATLSLFDAEQQQRIEAVRIAAEVLHRPHGALQLLDVAHYIVTGAVPYDRDMRAVTDTGDTPPNVPTASTVGSTPSDDDDRTESGALSFAPHQEGIIK